MGRALVTLLGLAVAGLVLDAVPEVTRFTDHPDWGVPALWALAGLVAVAAYRAGGPHGVSARPDVPLLVLAWLPWTAVAVAVIAHVTSEPSTIASHARDLVGSRLLGRLGDSVGPLAFGSGALLALALVGPRAVPVAPVVAPDEPAAVPAGRRSDIGTRDPAPDAPARVP